MTNPINSRRNAHISSDMPHSCVAANGDTGSCPIWDSAMMLNVWIGAWAEWTAARAAVRAAPSSTGLTTCEASSCSSESTRRSLL